MRKNTLEKWRVHVCQKMGQGGTEFVGGMTGTPGWGMGWNKGKKGIARTSAFREGWVEEKLKQGSQTECQPRM